MPNQQLIIGATTTITLPKAGAVSGPSNTYTLTTGVNSPSPGAAGLSGSGPVALRTAGNGYNCNYSGAHTNGGSTVTVTVTVPSGATARTGCELNVWDGTNNEYSGAVDIAGAAPTAPAAPTFGSVWIDAVNVNVPALAGGATSYDLQRL